MTSPRCACFALYCTFFALFCVQIPFSFAQSSCPIDPQRFGVVDQPGWAFFYRSQAEIARGLDLMQTAGIGWLRFNLAWKDVQESPDSFDYAQFDTVASLAAEHNIQLLPILMGIPVWASSAPDEMKAERGDMAPVDRYLPADLSGWIAYVDGAVERYDGDGTDDAPGSPRISHWEVWNEPNLALFWPPQASAEDYWDLFVITQETIRGADPTATVVLGGLSGSGVNEDGSGYLEQLYALGAGPYFDVVNVHLYTHPTNGTAGLQRALENTRRVMAANGDADKPLWLTETGWSEAPNAWGQPTVTPGEVASFLVSVYTAPLPVDKIFWYNFRDLDVSDNVEHNFGLLHRDFTPKPAYEAYAALAGNCS